MTKIREYLNKNDYITSENKIKKLETLSNGKQQNLIDDIKQHINNNCSCELVENGKGLCFVGSWVEGCLDTEDLIKLYKEGV